MKNKVISILVSAAMCISVFNLLSADKVNIDDNMLCYAETTYETHTLITEQTTFTTTTTATQEIAVSTYGPDKKYDHEGAFFISYTDNKWNYYVGEELDENSLMCSIAVKTEYGWYTEPLASYPAYGAMLDKYYTIDTSEVDMDTPGKYKIYVDTIDDNIVPVSVYGGNQYIPVGEYNILTKKSEKRNFVTITVSDGERPAPYEPQFIFGDSRFTCPDGEITKIPLLGCIYPDFTITSNDTSVVEVLSFDMYEDYSSEKPPAWGYLKVKGNKAGQTAALTAVDGKGRTAECKVFIEYTDKSYPEGALYFVSSENLLEGYVGESLNTHIKGYELDRFYEVGESPISFSIDDESVAVLTDIQGEIVNLEGVSVGETVLRAEAPDGRTAEIKVIIKERPPVVTTTVVSTVNYNHYTTVNTNVDIPGDLNGDKKVSVADLVMLHSLINSKKDFSAAADVNKDGTINVFDVVTLRRMILGE